MIRRRDLFSAACPNGILLSAATARHAFDAQELVLAYPPRFTNPNKRTVYEIACPPESVHAGRIEYSRWRAAERPWCVDELHTGVIELREGFFGYESSSSDDGTVEWYLNFAARDLFYAYPGSLFAQDEMQVAEHPALASLREALCEMGIPRWTVDKGRPSPILATGVERRCRVALDRDAGQGRPDGLYGNRFSRASESAIRRATREIVPPTITNILAIEAPVGGAGVYSAEEINFILTTAYGGFVAAAVESRRIAGSDTGILIHTGYWGCGAYGGNRVLMALLQMLAARLAGIDRLVFHYGSPEGRGDVECAAEVLLTVLCRVNTVQEIMDSVEGLQLRWGAGDGN